MKKLTQITTQNGVIVDLPDATADQIIKACQDLRKVGYKPPYQIETGFPAYCHHCNVIVGLADHPHTSRVCEVCGPKYLKNQLRIAKSTFFGTYR